MEKQQKRSRASPAAMGGGHGGKEDGQVVAREAASVAVDTCMVAAAASGALLLAWWSVAFHPSNSRLWMVPVGLVLACTPAVIFLALSFSPEPRVPAAGEKPPPLRAVVVEK